MTWPRAGVNLLRKLILRTVGMPPARSNDVAVAKPASELPSDFTPDLYLQLNPDLIAAGVDPLEHFLSNGQFESRLYTLPELFNEGVAGFNPIFETILVVSHEASRTGAPILALNLVQSFSNRYNIVVLLLGEGPLTGEFCSCGSVVFVEAFSRFNPFVARRVVGEICSRYQIKFGLVNSIESRQVLQGLAECGIPSVILIHEFASYTRPLEAFREAFAWASSVVFSAEITRDNAFLINPELAATPVSVHPQGKCVLPESIKDVSKEGVEKHLFLASVRPEHGSRETFVVLGAGAIHLRKGVDLFIDCAARYKRIAKGRSFRFVWIGGGYDPEGDVDYSSYLLDQIQRAELSEHVFFVGETSYIEAAYSNADVFLLTSRLDPLPNVAIDAMFHGVPVVCFDRCSGIADFLQRNDMGTRCVATYLDTDDAARKLREFAVSATLRNETGECARAAARDHFNMSRYVEEIERVALAAVSA